MQSFTPRTSFELNGRLGSVTDYRGPSDHRRNFSYVREGPWKYYVNYDGSDAQLFDLATNVSESINLADQHRDVVERLHGALLKWNESMPMDAGDPAFDPDQPAAAIPAASERN